jgi:hypothetical protein
VRADVTTDALQHAYYWARGGLAPRLSGQHTVRPTLELKRAGFAPVAHQSSTAVARSHRIMLVDGHRILSVDQASGLMRA